jgi:hypothetical protein
VVLWTLKMSIYEEDCKLFKELDISKPKYQTMDTATTNGQIRCGIIQVGQNLNACQNNTHNKIFRILSNQS